MEVHARTWTSRSRKFLVFLGAHPLRSLKVLSWTWQLVPCRQDGHWWILCPQWLIVRLSLPPILLWFKIFPLNFTFPLLLYNFSASLTLGRVCPKAASPPPVSSCPSLLAVNKTSLSKAAIAEEPQEYPFLVLSLFWCTDYPLVGSIAHLLLEVF